MTVDHAGRLLVGLFTEDRVSARGGVVAVDLGKGSVAPVVQGYVTANGLAVSPDGEYLYAVDTARGTLRRHRLGPRRGDPGKVLVDHGGPGVLDGIALGPGRRRVGCRLGRRGGAPLRPDRTAARGRHGAGRATVRGGGRPDRRHRAAGGDHGAVAAGAWRPHRSRCRPRTVPLGTPSTRVPRVASMPRRCRTDQGRTMMDRLETLLAERDCERLTYRYCRFADCGEASRLAELFTEDGVFSTPDMELRGRLEIAKTFAGARP